MSDKKCENCQHFMQHYGLCKGTLFKVYCGHCTFTSPRKKLPDAAPCEHFLPGSGAEEELVTKEYLTKELLQYVLSLELFPEKNENVDQRE